MVNWDTLVVHREPPEVIEPGKCALDDPPPCYGHDATGNVLAVYEQALGGKLVPPPALVKQAIYGSARLGERLTRGQNLSVSNSGLYARLVGQKRYELSDLLSNILRLLAY